MTLFMLFIIGNTVAFHLITYMCVGRPRDDSSIDMSDHEEEFYYTEVEENVDAVTQTFADMQTTSPTRTKFAQLSDAGALPDHDYQRKVFLYFFFAAEN